MAYSPMTHMCYTLPTCIMHGVLTYDPHVLHIDYLHHILPAYIMHGVLIYDPHVLHIAYLHHILLYYNYHPLQTC